MSGEEKVAFFAIAALVAIGLWRFIGSFLSGHRTPDPWDESVETAIQEPATPPLCHKCLVPQEHDRWFCPNCGASVGPYNNYLPYIQIFSQAEVLRTGTFEPARRRPAMMLFYALAAMAAFGVFAPLYWFMLLRNWTNSSQGSANPPAQPRQYE